MIGTKNGKNKIQGLKWESPENVGTKMCFSPKKNRQFRDKKTFAKV